MPPIAPVTYAFFATSPTLPAGIAPVLAYPALVMSVMTPTRMAVLMSFVAPYAYHAA